MNQIVSGSATVWVHGAFATRIEPSGDSTACRASLISTGPPATVLIGGPSIESSLALARSLIRLEGTADANDAELVAQELSLYPPHLLRVMIDGGVNVVACRGSVTEYRTDLSGQRPRGWPPGSTWDTVPGLFDREQNEVIIATRGHGTPAGPYVPPTGDGHGSSNLVLHEAGHAVDTNVPEHLNSSSEAFAGARDDDLDTLSDYETQAGEAGERETYAESLARYYGGDPDDATDHPSLHDHWDSDPFGSEP